MNITGTITLASILLFVLLVLISNQLLKALKEKDKLEEENEGLRIKLGDMRMNKALYGMRKNKYISTLG